MTKTTDIIINHSYKVPYQKVEGFEYEQYDDVIGVVSYQPIIEEQMPYVLETLNKCSKSRQAVIIVNRPDHMSCMLSAQFQIHTNILYVTVNLRSQATKYLPLDAGLFQHLATYVMDNLKKPPRSVSITVNVGNFHRIK